MAAGATQLTILDGNAVARTVQVWSSTGAITGNLSPLQGILGADGLAIASAANPSPVTAGNFPATVDTGAGASGVNTLRVEPTSSAAADGGFAKEAGGNLATLAGAITSSVVQSNTKQVNGVTTLAGAGAVGTGAQRIAVGQDTTTIAGSAPGTAGTPSTNVVSVQGVASGTAIPITAASLPLPTGAATASNITSVLGTANVSGVITAATAPVNGLAILGVHNTTPPTVGNGQSAALQLAADGSLNVTIVSGGGSGGTSSNFASTFPTAGTAMGAKNGANMVSLAADAQGDLQISQGLSSSLNITTAAAVKASAGRLARISVSVAGTAGGTVNDCATTGAAAAANQIGVIPNSVGVYLFDWPCATGIVVVPGAGQTVAVSYT